MTDDAEAETLAWETAMLAQIERHKGEIERLTTELRAYQQAMDGMAIVPIEPTMAMLSAAATAWNADTLKRTSTIWKAMIEAGAVKP